MNTNQIIMNSDIAPIASFGKWSSISGGIFTSISAISFFPLYYDFSSNSGVNYFCWLIVAASYLLMTLSHGHIVKTTRANKLAEVFYADVASALAIVYCVYECAVYYIQLTYLRMAASESITTSLLQDEPGTPVFALDIFGYFWLSVSTIFLALSMESSHDQKFLKYLLYFHGSTGCTCIFVPTLPMMYNSEGDDTTWQVVLLFWCAQFVPICFMMSNYFSSCIVAHKKI